MVKASALYMVIIIALVIGILCSSLIVAGYYYRLQYQKSQRYQLLQNNVGSAVNLLLASQDTGYAVPRTFSLFQLDADSVSVQIIPWGIYTIGVAKALIQRDTLYRIFSMAHTIDSGKWAALYLTDNSRPLALSGKTAITGDVFISPAGVNQAYVNNQAYSGDKTLIKGKIHASEKTLPDLLPEPLERLKTFTQQDRGSISTGFKTDSINNSFLLPTMIFNFGHAATTLSALKLSGNIILFSDTALTIDSTTVLRNVIVIAKSITVRSGFHGSCQLFVQDTIGIQNNCRFDFPSCAAVLRFQKGGLVKTPAKVALYKNTVFAGSVFIYEVEKSALKPVVHIGSSVKLTGQVYSPGYVELEDHTIIAGSIFTDGFLYQSTFTRYENYLINTTVSSKALSPYYLTSGLFPVAQKKHKVLQWLEAN
jgi:hypothetical protein